MMLNQSKASLREIFFHFSQGAGVLQRGGNLKPFQFVLRLMKELQAFKDARLVTIDAPLPLALKAGREQQLSLTSSTMDHRSLSGSQVSRVMKEARKLVGSGVTGLSLLYETSENVGKDEVMAELLDSSLVTLQHLDLDLILSNNDRELWTDSLKFRDLLSLRLCLWGSDEEEILPEVPEDIPTSKLLDLDLTLKDWEVNWGSLGRWIGCSLEKLTLNLDSRSSRGIEQLFERNSHSVNFNFKETLQILNLRNISYEAPSETEVEADLFFPSLEEVSFHFLTTSPFDFLSNLTSPKLRFLSITSAADEIGDLKSLFNMLKSHASNLVELHLNVLRKDSDPIPSGGSIFKKDPLRFECLQKLVLKSFSSEDTCTSLGMEENFYFNLIGLSSSDDDTFSSVYRMEADRQMRTLFSKNAPKLEI